MEDEGEVTDLLNIEISRQGTSVSLRQTGYITKLTKEWFPHGTPANKQLNSVPHPEDIRELVIHATSEGAPPANQTLINNYTASSWALSCMRLHPRALILPTPQACSAGRCRNPLTCSWRQL